MKAVEDSTPLESVDTFASLGLDKGSDMDGGGILWEKFPLNPTIEIDPGNDTTLLQRVDRLDNLVSTELYIYVS